MLKFCIVRVVVLTYKDKLLWLLSSRAKASEQHGLSFPKKCWVSWVIVVLSLQWLSLKCTIASTPSGLLMSPLSLLFQTWNNFSHHKRSRKLDWQICSWASSARTWQRIDQNCNKGTVLWSRPYPPNVVSKGSLQLREWAKELPDSLSAIGRPIAKVSLNIKYFGPSTEPNINSDTWCRCGSH